MEALTIIQLLFTALCGLVFKGVSYGLWKRSDQVVIEQIKKFGNVRPLAPTIQLILIVSQIAKVLELHVIFDTGFVKLSVGFLLLRLCDKRKPFVWTIWITMAIVTLSTIASFVLILLSCNPAASQPRKGCFKMSAGASGIPFGVIDIVTDWVFAILPIVLLLPVQLPVHVKVPLMILLALGIVYVR